MVARGRRVLSEALLEGKIGMTDGLQERVSKCLGCMACSENCPSGVDVVKLLAAVRSQIIEDKGLDIISSFLLKGIFKNRLFLSLSSKCMELSIKLYNLMPSHGLLGKFAPYSIQGVKRIMPPFGGRNLRRGLPEVIRVDNPVARVAFYTGCMTDLAYQDVGRAVISILKKGNVEIIVPREQVCCGAPAYYIGDRKRAIDLTKRNIEVFKSFNVDAIITCCATCGTMLKEVYPILVDSRESRAISDKTVDIQKFIADRLENFIPHFYSGRGDILKVTYHDPCHLRRGQKIISHPRDILKNIPGVEYIEMEDADRCCGGGGTFNLKYYDLSMSIGRYKTDKIKKTGADIVATACPSCQMQLTDILNRSGVKAKVVHTVQILERVFNDGNQK